jgi:hypothetical protein
MEIVFNDICGLYHFEKSKSKYGFRIAAYFSVVTPSAISSQLPASPMMVFPVGIEHALDVPVQRSRPILR